MEELTLRELWDKLKAVHESFEVRFNTREGTNEWLIIHTDARLKQAFIDLDSGLDTVLEVKVVEKVLHELHIPRRAMFMSINSIRDEFSERWARMYLNPSELESDQIH